MPPKYKAPVDKAALKFLSRREHARYELWEKLVKCGYEPSSITEALDDLAEKGFLSEERFIEAYLESRRKRNFGPDRIRIELRRKGVDLATAEDFIDAVDWISEARRVAERKFGAATPSNKEESLQFRRYLRQRGFAWDTIDAVAHNRD